jgi:phage terminase small subunit
MNTLFKHFISYEPSNNWMAHFFVKSAILGSLMGRNELSMILNPQERIFVDSIASGLPILQAATHASISLSTGKRWMKRPDIQEAFRNISAKFQEQAEQTAAEIILEKYKDALVPACDAVVEIVKNPEESGATRLKAAQMIQDRLAPMLKLEQQPVEQETTVPRDLLQYATPEELIQIDELVTMLQQRKAQAEQDREKLHLKAL